MDFPIRHHIHSFERVQALIPKDRLITKDEIFNMTDLDIHDLKIYFGYTYPKESYSNNYECLLNILHICDKIFLSLQNGDIILAPGDSPSKIVYLINTFYCLGDENYLRQEDVLKLKFVQFPLSGISGSITDYSLLDNYLRYILSINNVHNVNNIVFLDYFDSGGTYYNILSSLKRITGNNNFQMKIINLKTFEDEMINGDECKLNYVKMIAESELINSRCISKYTLGSTEPSLIIGNALRCNVILIILVLLRYEKLGEMPMIPSEPDLSQFTGKFANITYYDTEIESIKQELFRIKHQAIAFVRRAQQLSFVEQPDGSFIIKQQMPVNPEFYLQVEKISTSVNRNLYNKFIIELQEVLVD